MSSHQAAALPRRLRAEDTIDWCCKCNSAYLTASSVPVPSVRVHAVHCKFLPPLQSRVQCHPPHQRALCMATGAACLSLKLPAVLQHQWTSSEFAVAVQAYHYTMLVSVFGRAGRLTHMTKVLLPPNLSAIIHISVSCSEPSSPGCVHCKSDPASLPALPCTAHSILPSIPLDIQHQQSLLALGMHRPVRHPLVCMCLLQHGIVECRPLRRSGRLA